MLFLLINRILIRPIRFPNFLVPLNMILIVRLTLINKIFPPNTPSEYQATAVGFEVSAGDESTTGGGFSANVSTILAES